MWTLIHIRHSSASIGNIDPLALLGVSAWRNAERRVGDRLRG